MECSEFGLRVIFTILHFLCNLEMDQKRKCNITLGLKDLSWKTLELSKPIHELRRKWTVLNLVLESYSIYFIFFVTYKWAQKAEVSHNIRLERLAIVKHSSIQGQLICHKENEVLWIRPQKLLLMKHSCCLPENLKEIQTLYVNNFNGQSIF